MTTKIAPAPWQLTGQGYLIVVQLPKHVLDNESFIDPKLKSSRRGRVAYVDKRYFPDFTQGRVLACFKVTDFNLVFPVPKTQAI